MTAKSGVSWKKKDWVAIEKIIAANTTLSRYRLAKMCNVHYQTKRFKAILTKYGVDRRYNVREIRRLIRLGMSNDEIKKRSGFGVSHISKVRNHNMMETPMEREPSVTINYLEAIKPFRGLDLADPKIIEAINAHNRTIQRDMDGFRGRE